MVDHIVLLKIGSSVAPEDLKDLADAVRGLTSIEGVDSVTWGPSVSQEGLEAGHTHGFVVRMRDATVLKNYAPHPVHQVVVQHVQAMADGVLVFDIQD
jgi:Stress responsive A/B Barrel Domain